MSVPSWEQRVAGDGCPLDAPRADSTDQWDLVARLSVSSLYLAKDQTYRGRCQLVFDPRHASRVDELTPEEWAAHAADLYVAHVAIVRAVRPDHVNVESLGNVVPHLHWHLIPRYKDDPAWGAPIWDTPPSGAPDGGLSAAGRAALLDDLRRHLSQPGA